MANLRITLARRSWRVPLGDTTTIGRDEANQVIVGDAFVSRFHAQIDRDGNTFTLRDLATSNGTFVNGQRIELHQLRDGDEVRIGTAILRYEAAGAAYDSGEIALIPNRELFNSAQWLAFEGDQDYEPQQSIEDPDSLRRPYEKLRVANALARSLGNAPNLDALLERILKTTTELFGSDRGAVLVLDPKSRQVKRQLAHRRSESAGKIELPQTVVDQVIATRSGVVSSMDGAGPAGARSILCAPMVHQEQAHGLLYLDADRSRAFDVDDLELLSAVANQAGVAVNNALLVAKVSAMENAERARMDALISALPDAVYLLDGAHRIVASNPTANALLPTLACHDPTATLTGDTNDLRSIAGHPIDEIVSRARQSGIEIQIPGLRRWFRIESPPIARAVSDDSTQTVLVVRETTRDRQQRQLSVQQERLAVVGQLAAGVAHEVNNPLTYVLANLDFLAAEVESNRERLEQDSYTDLSDALREAREGASRVRAIVHDLKMFSRTEEQAVGPIDVHATIDSALKMLSGEVRHRATLVTEYEAEAPVVASRARLSQLFLNLLINSTQALPVGNADNNEIRVATRLDQHTGNVVVEISDSGPGVPEDLRKKIFEPFFTTKPVGAGTGLGLFVCHNIVSALGGQIEVGNRPSGGALFRIELPSTVSFNADEAPGKRSKKSSTAPPPEPDNEPRVRVLVVDDEPLVLKALTRQLREYDVTPCNSGTKALELLRQQSYDIVLCDLMMPDLTGMDLFEEVEQFDAGLAGRIVFMTGGAFTDRATEFLASVENPRIEKPVHGKRLSELAEAARSARSNAG